MTPIVFSIYRTNKEMDILLKLFNYVNDFYFHYNNFIDINSKYKELNLSNGYSLLFFDKLYKKYNYINFLYFFDNNYENDDKEYKFNYIKTLDSYEINNIINKYIF